MSIVRELKDIPISIVLLPIAVGILMLAAIKQASSMVMPQIHVQQLHIREDSIKIGLEFSRHRVPSPVRYNDVNITLYHASSDQVAGQSVIPGFNMGWDEKTVHREAVVAARGLPWEDALRKIGDGSTVDLRVALTTKYRTDDYDDCCCCTVKKAMAVAADFRVDGFGKASNKPMIRLQDLDSNGLSKGFIYLVILSVLVVLRFIYYLFII